MNDEELKYRLALHFLPGIGPVLARALLSYCGSIENIFRKKKSQLEKIPGIGRERAELIQKKDLFEKAEKEIDFMQKNGIEPLFYIDKNFPERLKNCYDAPLMLFYKGNIDLNSSRMVAVVGTRFITPYGKDMTEKLIAELAQYNVVIVSGLAYGVDVQAHKSSINYNVPTIGVVAHGLDRLYPSDNKATADKMMLNGGIISEYPSGIKPDRENFPARNRIVAGMSDAVIVIESAERGGALITAEMANEYNRDVFALPGRTTDHFSKGCHLLIRKNKAMLFESAEQIAEIMNWTNNNSAKKNKQSFQAELFTNLNDDEKKIVDILKANGQTAIDLLAANAGMAVSKASVSLLNLEFAGLLRSLPGKIYELI
jgi:DNA processing protein